MVYVAITFFFVALVLFFILSRLKKSMGLPAGRVIYSDTHDWLKVEKPLFDPDLRLTGKPDYLIEQGNLVIPVEVKSRNSPSAPYDSHIFQLAAYCLLVQHEHGKRPKYGILHYKDRTFAIDFSTSLEESVKAVIREMQEMAKKTQVDRSHDKAHICQNCGYRSICDQALRI